MITDDLAKSLIALIKYGNLELIDAYITELDY